MKHLRTKFILVLVCLTLLPAVVIAYVARDLLERALALGLNPEIAANINVAWQAAQATQARVRNELASEMKKVAAALRHRSPAAIALRDSNYAMTLINADDQSHTWGEFSVPQIPDLHGMLSLAPDSLIDAGSDSLKIQLAMNLHEGVVLLGQRPIPSELRQQVTTLSSMAQYFNSISLEHTRLQRIWGMTFLAVYAPILLLSLAIGWYLARRITAPVEGLVEATQRVAQGDWQHRVTVRSSDEIGEMGRAFNAMIENLKRQQEQVISLEKMAAWRDIARVLAHEIKNPLTPIQLMVQQIRDDYRGDHDDFEHTLAECGQIIEEEIEKLRVLVREFSDFARMPELHPSPGNLNELVEDVAKLYSGSALRLCLDDSLPVISFDWEAMRRVLINLIENALQASAEAKIAITTQYSNGEGKVLELLVTDNGTGIPPENLGRIFEPHFSTKKTGMGLGLAIVKRIVEEHGGSIQTTSEVGNGTTFQIRLMTTKT